MEGESIGSLGQLDNDWIVRPLVGVILRQLHAQAPSLHSDGRVALRIESARPAQNLSGDLIFLERLRQDDRGSVRPDSGAVCIAIPSRGGYDY